MPLVRLGTVVVALVTCGRHVRMPSLLIAQKRNTDTLYRIALNFGEFYFTEILEG